MNRPLMLVLSGLLLASLLAFGIFFSSSKDYAKIVGIQGDVFIERGGEKIAATPYMVLNSRDRIETSQGSFVEVAYDDKMSNVVKIGQGSRVVLESSVIAKNTELFMDKGSIMVKLSKMATNSTFKVRTPVAICGVRGTGFGVALNGNSATITEYESAVYVKGITRAYEEMPGELVLEEGWKTRVDKFEAPSKVERLTDSEYQEWKDWTVQIWSLAQEPVKILPGGSGDRGYDARNAITGYLTPIRSPETFLVAR